MTTQTPQEQLDYLLEVIWHPTNAEVTIGMIRDTIGLTPEQYALVRGTLEKAINELTADPDPINRIKGIDLKDARDAMLSRGISFSDANRQATIDELASFGEWPDAVRDAVKALGGSYMPRWQSLGMAATPTIETILEAIADAEEAIHRQRARLAGARFGEQFAQGQDAGEVMAAIWGEINGN